MTRDTVKAIGLLLIAFAIWGVAACSSPPGQRVEAGEDVLVWHDDSHGVTCYIYEYYDMVCLPDSEVLR